MSSIKSTKICKAILYGTIIGILDVMPMIAQHMSIWTNLSAFTHWIIVSLFIAITNIRFLKNSITKGIIIAILLLIPTALVVWPSDTTAIMPMSLSTLIFGGLLGWLLK